MHPPLVPTTRDLDASRVLALRPGDRVAVVGSGGKTTLLRRLSWGVPGGVLLTTTTRMAAPGDPEDPPFLPFREAGDFRRLWEALPPRRRFLTGRFLEGDAKMRGLSPEEVDALADLPGLDLLVVEADGSRCLPAKAHESFEPVLFSRCTVGVAVLGMQALGRPVREGLVHRAHLVRERLGVTENHALDLGDLERIAASYLERLPGLRPLMVLSQVEAASEEVVRELARRLAPRVDRVVLQGRDRLEEAS